MMGKGPVPLSIEKVCHLSRSSQPLARELERWGVRVRCNQAVSRVDRPPNAITPPSTTRTR